MAKRNVLPGFLGGIQDSIRKHPLRSLAAASGAAALLFAAAFLVLAAGLGERNGRIDALRRGLGELTDDYNLLRASLGLPPREFSQGAEAAASGDQARRSPLAQGLQIIQSRYYDEAKARQFEEFKTGPLWRAVTAESGCVPAAAGLFAADWVKKNNVCYSLAWQPDTLAVTLRASGIGEEYAGADPQAAAAFVRSTVKKIDGYYGRLAALKKELASLGTKGPIAAALSAKGLEFQYRGEDPGRFWAAVSKDKEDLLTVSFDKRGGAYAIDEKKIERPETIAAELEKAVRALDARTAAEKRLDAVTASLKESFRDPDFRAACREASLAVVETPRVTEDFILFDVRHRGEKIGSVAVNRETADVYFVDKDDVVLSSLKAVAGPEGLKKKILTPAAEAAGTATFLLLGRNGENTDTMILVRADERTRGLVMISLPRDLFYHGLKINRLHQRGFEYCAREVSALTGVPVSKFAVIDLYSLIAVIDALGGVEVDLPFDLIDPEYRIKENGVWRTLAYPKGHYHLSGVQAMRLIRSRGNSSDFQRAHRQHIVIDALFEQLKARCGGSLETSLSVFSALAGYVTTNVTPLEIAKTFVMFKDYKITGAYVLDTTNILRATYSALYRLPEEEQQKIRDLHDEEALGAYILLPRDNDWGLIQSYIRVLLAGGK